MKVRCWLLSILAVALLFFTGCAVNHGGARYTEDGRIIVRVSMYNNSMYPQWRSYVEENCPDIFIQWENNYNSTTNVLYQARHDDLADIISIRRFESDTSSRLEPYLLDLSKMEVTQAFEPQYLEPFCNGGKQCWLPAPGVFDGLVANADLYKQYGVQLPTDWKSFLAGCDFWQKHQVEGFVIDGKEPWTPIQLIEGLGMVDSARSESGKAWLQQFAENTATTVDAALFASVADKLRLLREKGLLTREDLQTKSAKKDVLMLTRRAALVRQTSDTFFAAGSNDHYVALPFFGETEADNWLYTYPAFVLSRSKASQKEEAVSRAAQKVLEVMLSKGAQRQLNANCEGLISYNKDFELPLSASMRIVQPLISQQKCFIRTLNSHSFEASELALKALVEQGADNEQFFKILNDNLFKENTVENLGICNVAATPVLDDALCSAVGSVIAQVLQEETGAACTLIDMREAPSALYKGPFSNEDLDAVVTASKIYRGMLTGEQLSKLLADSIWGATTFVPGGIEPLVDYPVLAGLTVSLQKNGTFLKGVFTSGQTIDLNQVYPVAISSNIYQALLTLNKPLAKAFTPEELTLKQYFSNGFKKKGSLPLPQTYFKYRSLGAKL